MRAKSFSALSADRWRLSVSVARGAGAWALLHGQQFDNEPAITLSTRPFSAAAMPEYCGLRRRKRMHQAALFPEANYRPKSAEVAM